MLRLLNLGMHSVHLALIAFTCVGWIWPETRLAHLILCGLTLCSWFLLGPLIGKPGFCAITGVQHALWSKQGRTDHPSYMSLLFETVTRRRASAHSIGLATQIVFYGLTALSLALWTGFLSTPEETPNAAPYADAMSNDQKINYIELPGDDMAALEAFYSSAFGWTFTSYGPDYHAFCDGTMNGGFFRSDKRSTADNGSALIVLFADDLEATRLNVLNNKGTISTETFDFPGGRRFHFQDPHGNELAVWSDK